MCHVCYLALFMLNLLPKRNVWLFNAHGINSLATTAVRILCKSKGLSIPALETTSCLLYEKSVAYNSYFVAGCFNMGAIDRDESLAIGFVTPEMVVLKNVLRKTILIA